MRHPGSGPQHTLNPQPSLTDGRGEGEGGEEEGRGSGGLHTNHSQINSLLPQSTILPPFSLPHLSLFFLLPAHILTSPSFLSSSQFFISSPMFLLPPLHPSFSIPLYPHPYMLHGLPKLIFMPPAWRPGEKKNDTWRYQGSGRQAVPLVKVLDLG